MIGLFINEQYLICVLSMYIFWKFMSPANVTFGIHIVSVFLSYYNIDTYVPKYICVDVYV